MTTNMNTILNLPVELDFQVRSFLCEELCTTSSVCKDWEILNREISKILLEKIFPLFPIYKNFSFNNQYCFLKKLSDIGDYPKEIIKIIGEFYQFKKLPMLEPRGFSCTIAKEMSFPIMVGRNTWNWPCAAFKLRYVKPMEKLFTEVVLICGYNFYRDWFFKYGDQRIPDEELVFDKKSILIDGRMFLYRPYEENIEVLENVANNMIENIDIPSDDS